MDEIIKENGLLENGEVSKIAFKELIDEYKEKINNINNQINRLNIDYTKENIKKEISLNLNEEAIKKYFNEINELKLKKAAYCEILNKLEVNYVIYI